MKDCMLALADLKDYSEEQIKNHLAENYKGTPENYSGVPVGEFVSSEQIEEELKNEKILVAYESVGNWGCGSSSFFLIQRVDDSLFEIHGSHCSCFGMEGQFVPQESEWSYLVSNHFSFSCGGYDDDDVKHKKQVKHHIAKLKDLI